MFKKHLFSKVGSLKATDGISHRSDKFGVAHYFGHISLDFENSFHNAFNKIFFPFNHFLVISI